MLPGMPLGPDYCVLWSLEVVTALDKLVVDKYVHLLYYWPIVCSGAGGLSKQVERLWGRTTVCFFMLADKSKHKP
jgi:hypothetical protein